MKITLIFILFLSWQMDCFASDYDLEFPTFAQSDIPEIHPKKRVPKYFYTYADRTHTFEESAKLVAAIYGVTWLLYPLTQPKVFRDNGSFSNYKRNFGRLVFDRDEPFWNWIVHPISGSQLFLFYRANGYSRIDSLAMSFLSSTLFEFTVEIYTEPASVQDLYQTPVIGSILGIGIENLSLYLLNTGNPIGKFLGHIINPSTFFWYFEGKIKVTPTWDGKKRVGLFVFGEF